MDENRNTENINETKESAAEITAEGKLEEKPVCEEQKSSTDACAEKKTEQSESNAQSGKTTVPPPPKGAYPPPPPFQNRAGGAYVPPQNPQNPYGAPRPQGAYPPPRPPYPPYAAPYAPYAQPKKKKHTGLYVTLGVVGFLFILLVIIGIAAGGSDDTPINGVPSLSESYVAVLYIDDEISGDYQTTKRYGSYSNYNQVFLIDTVYGLADDPNNAGLMLYIDSPGGEVIATDEMGRAVEYYKNTTERPVYAYFSSVAASGAYWIGSYADKIIANKYCTTGSIGVTYGAHIEISELLEKLGIKVTTIASGENKGMGSMYEPLTDEQRKILEEQINEMHDGFVKLVADNRGLPESKVREIADGRTMLSSKALSLGLIDGIGYYEDAQATMISDCSFDENIIFYDCINTSLSQSIDLMSLLQSEENKPLSEEEALSALIKDIEENRKFMVKYE